MKQAFNLSSIHYKTINEANFSLVMEIYAQGIAGKQATFETSLPSWEKWNQSHLPHSRIAAYIDASMIGWASLSAVSDRCVYEGVAEVSIYIHDQYKGKGIGNLLIKRLIDESEANGIWSLMAGIFPENVASMKLHQQNGFRLIGIREKIGKQDGIWRDTALFQRRSKINGID